MAIGKKSREKPKLKSQLLCTTVEKVSNVHEEFCALGTGVISSDALVNTERSVLQKQKGLIVALADFHGVNTSTVADFKPPLV